MQCYDTKQFKLEMLMPLIAFTGKGAMIKGIGSKL
jgi:hypothetical protein